MKYFLSVAVFCLTVAMPVKPKAEFEGVIRYHSRSWSPIRGVEAPQIFGEVLTMYYKDGEFKYVSAGGMVDAIYYKRDNNEYTKMRDSDTLLWGSCAKEDRILHSMKTVRKDTVILGYTCDRMEVKLGNVELTYWYSNKLYVDGKRFADRKLGRLDLFYGETCAQILKFRYKTSYFAEERTAFAVEPKPLSADEFVLPDLPRMLWTDKK